MNSFRSRSVHLFIINSRKCNLGCDYCFQNDRDIKTGAKIPKENVDKFIEFLWRNPNVNQLTFFGGEPLMEPKISRQILDAVREINKIPGRGLKVMIITNGTIYLPWLKKYKNEVFGVQISIDGGPALHNKHRTYKNGEGSFEDAIETLKKYNADGLHTSTHSVVNLEELDLFESCFDELLDRVPDKTYISFEIVHNYQDHKIFKMWSRIRRLYKLVSRKKAEKNLPHLYFSRGYTPESNMNVCSAGSNFLTVDLKNGQFFYCPERIHNEDEAVGNLSNDPWIDATKLSRFTAYQDRSKFRIQYIPSKFISKILFIYYQMAICTNENIGFFNDPYKVPFKTLLMSYYGKKFHDRFKEMLMRSLGYQRRVSELKEERKNLPEPKVLKSILKEKQHGIPENN